MRVYDTGYTILEPGRYRFRIDEAAWGKSKANKDVMKCVFVVIDGEFEGAVLKKSLPNWILCILASALGVEKKKDETGKSFYDVDGVDIRGKCVWVGITSRTHEGKVYSDMETDFELSDETDETPF